MRSRDALIAGAAIAALVLWARTPRGRVIIGEPYLDPPPWQPGDGYHDPVYDDPDEGDEFTPVEATFEFPGEQVPVGVDWFAGAGSMTDIFNRNTDALIDAIIAAEHYPGDVASGRAYNTFYGRTYFEDFSDHPVLTGEKQKIELPERYCRAAGYKGKCYTTAAGALQITVPTWREFRSRGPYLADFSPASQREAGRRILNAIGALKLLQDGDFAGAVSRASARWASLPGSYAGQAGGKSLAWVHQKFTDAGGVA